jgi:hypothetical protein
MGLNGCHPEALEGCLGVELFNGFKWLRGFHAVQRDCLFVYRCHPESVSAYGGWTPLAAVPKGV